MLIGFQCNSCDTENCPTLRIYVYLFQKVIYLLSKPFTMKSLYSSINRSPLYSHFSEMIEGMILIRNFRTINNVIDENNKLLLNLIRCEFSGLLLSSWLSIRLQMVGITFVIGIIVLSLIVNYYGFASVSIFSLLFSYRFFPLRKVSSVWHVYIPFHCPISYPVLSLLLLNPRRNLSPLSDASNILLLGRTITILFRNMKIVITRDYYLLILNVACRLQMRDV